MAKTTPNSASGFVGITPALDERIHLEDVRAALTGSGDKLYQLQAIFDVLRRAFSPQDPNYHLAELGFEEAERFGNYIGSIGRELAAKGVRHD